MDVRTLALLASCLALAGCSREQPAALAPAPAPPKPPPAVPAESAPPVDPAPPAPKSAPPPPRIFPPASASQSPTFTFRAFEDIGEVSINGVAIGTTPHPWWVSGQTEFDPRIRVDAWPPEGAVLASRGVRTTDDGTWTSMELWIAGGKYEERAELRRLHPHVAEDEHVLYVKACLSEGEIRGAVRLRVAGRRFVRFIPTQITEESEDFLKWSRSIWFERD